MTTCKGNGCGAAVVWVKTKRGKQMPCDIDRLTVKRRHPLFDKDRERATVVTDDGEVVDGVLAGTGDDPEDLVVGRRPHWASCPAAAEFRRKNDETQGEP